MTYIASISAFYSDTCIIYATLSLSYFALSKNVPFSSQSELWRRVLFGVLAGLVVLYLNQDRLELAGGVYYSFGMIPMILATFFGGGVSGVVCYLVSFFFTGGFTLDNLFIASIILPLLLSAVWRKKSHGVFYLTIGIIALYRIAVVSTQVKLSELWTDILLYQAAAALCLSICYHALNFKERHMHAFFSMRNKATTDSLTNINNRASVDYKMMIQHAQRQPCGLIMLDLDNFKRVNDTYGHLAGDSVLVSLGGILQDSVRNEDFVGRYGGEEFIVITSSYDPQHIGAVAERIRSKVESFHFKTDDGNEIRMTISIGTSLFLPGMAVDKAIEITDEALYDAKHGGKNRVVSSRLMQLAPLGDSFRQGS
ncbi:membrane protein [Chania multitudinisentens RB-25]|uniref:diguanylate cyclase n=1 Tax=Chania multitudinisentens RB-25 TaxID=1441930 RepID=W0L7R8_9GAMM|nr:GGDEF domain-containing protein [Chania multitudinisentens]AHG18404.1 membrane protein [Chania multitudinisentens RB-25]